MYTFFHQIALEEEDVWRAILNWAKYQAGVTQPTAHWTEEERIRVCQHLSDPIKHVRLLLIGKLTAVISFCHIRVLASLLKTRPFPQIRRYSPKKWSQPAQFLWNCRWNVIVSPPYPINLRNAPKIKNFSREFRLNSFPALKFL